MSALITLINCSQECTQTDKPKKNACPAIVATHVGKLTKLKYEKFQQYLSDSIWYRTYRVINNQMIRPVLQATYEKFAAQLELGINDVSTFYLITTNFDYKYFKTSAFQTRYPFASEKSIRARFKKMVEAGLLTERSETFSISEKGKTVAFQMVQEITKADISQLSREELKVLIQIFEGIIEQAIQGDTKYMFPSLIQKSNSLIHSSTNQTLRLVLLVDDLTAMRNDASHYSLEYLNSYHVELPDLSHESVEILISSKTQYFDQNSFKNRSTWGHSGNETKRFMDELVNTDLAEWVNDSTIQFTDGGKILYSDLTLNTEKVFYTPWMSMSDECYNILLELVTRSD